ncbi:MAG: hypothetical protein IVW55_16750 [Chloroflexi bacterium]|nr:hypothetical protein [Chloroflexota bacterium]
MDDINAVLNRLLSEFGDLNVEEMRDNTKRLQMAVNSQQFCTAPGNCALPRNPMLSLVDSIGIGLTYALRDIERMANFASDAKVHALLTPSQE